MNSKQRYLIPIREPGWPIGRAAFYSLLTAYCFLLTSCHARAADERPNEIRASVYSQFTVVVCNRAAPQSEELARHYARSREIPQRNVVVLDCASTEEISRREFEDQIHQPLRDAMLTRGWWMPVRDPKTGAQSLRSEVKILALMHGVPVKIRDDTAAAGSGKTSAASVDSELCTLGQPGLTTAGPLTNPYYRSQFPFHATNLPIMLVGRIDGPNPEICRRMIDDTIRAETRGLWGQAYIDLGSNLEQAESWLEKAASHIRRIGIPVTVDHHPENFPTSYPLGDPILYLGAGTEHANGPFKGKGRAFRPGAVACHVHPRNAATLRATEEHWAGSLLDEGAAAVLGAVYESHPAFTHQLDIFTDRLTRGFSFIESAYMAQQGVSWVNVAIGDPLYTPFPDIRSHLDETQYKRKSSNMPYQVLRLAYARWGNGEPFPERTLYYKLELASAKSTKPEFLEHLAICAIETKDFDEARIQLSRAGAAYEDPADKLRIKLHEAEMHRQLKDRLDAFKTLRDAARDFADISESKAAAELMKIVQKRGG